MSCAVIPVQTCKNQQMIVGKRDKSYWAYAIRITAALAQPIDFVQPFHLFMIEHQNWLWKLPLVKLTPSGDIKLSVPFFDQAKWDQYMQKLQLVLPMALLHLILLSPIDNNPFITDDNNVPFRLPSLKKATFHDCFQLQVLDSYNAIVTRKLKCRKLVNVLKSMTFLNILKVIHNEAFSTNLQWFLK